MKNQSTILPAVAIVGVCGLGTNAGNSLRNQPIPFPVLVHFRHKRQHGLCPAFRRIFRKPADCPEFSYRTPKLPPSFRAVPDRRFRGAGPLSPAPCQTAILLQSTDHRAFRLSASQPALVLSLCSGVAVIHKRKRHRVSRLHLSRPPVPRSEVRG